MSLINEALKQARGETSANGSSSLGISKQHGAPAASSARGRDSLIIFLLLICLVMLGLIGAGGVYYYKRGQKAPVVAEHTATTPPALPAVATAPTVPATITPVTTPPVATPTPAAVTPPVTAPVETVATTPAPTQPPAPVPQPRPEPNLVQLAPAEIAAKYPVKGIMKTANGHMALLSSRIVYPGDQLPDGALITEIAPRHVHIKIGEDTYRLLLN
jgi:hypothetical protein